MKRLACVVTLAALAGCSSSHRGTSSGVAQRDTTSGAGALLATPAYLPISSNGIAIADLNCDGIPDLASVDASLGQFSQLSILTGKGDGTFPNKYDFGPLVYPVAVAVADLNGDSYLDVAVAVETGVAIWLNAGPNGAGPQLGTMSIVPVRFQPESLTIADVNGDQIPDLLVPASNGGDESLLLGKGDGTFGSETVLTVAVEPTQIAVGDVNGDGLADLVVTDSGLIPGQTPTGQETYVDDSFFVLLGSGGGTSFWPAVPYKTGVSQDSIVLADFNGDGVLDVATTNFFSNTVSILLGAGDGTFGAKNDLSLHNGPTCVVSADFNADGVADLAVAYGPDSSVDPGEVPGGQVLHTVGLLLGNGDGTFQASVDTRLQLGYPGRPMVVVADVDGDGKPDVVATQSAGGKIAVLRNAP